MMPGPYHEWSRIESSERVRKAHEEGRAKDVRKTTNGLAVYGLLVSWALFMAAMIGLWLWIG
jgi:hypothetical protein